MIRKNIYSRITESIVNAYHNNNLDTAMEDGHEMENMGKKIVAIITADPDQDLDWESEYEPFGATELTADDEQEDMEYDGIETVEGCEGDECDAEQDTCVSCGHPVINSEDDDEVGVKDILLDILDELRGDGGDSEDEGVYEGDDDKNPMFDDSSDDDESEEDYDSMLSDNGSDEWDSDESDDEESDDESDDDDYDEEEDFESPFIQNHEVDEKMFN